MKPEEPGAFCVWRSFLTLLWKLVSLDFSSWLGWVLGVLGLWNSIPGSRSQSAPWASDKCNHTGPHTQKWALKAGLDACYLEILSSFISESVSLKSDRTVEPVLEAWSLLQLTPPALDGFSAPHSHIAHWWLVPSALGRGPNCTLRECQGQGSALTPER